MWFGVLDGNVSGVGGVGGCFSAPKEHLITLLIETIETETITEAKYFSDTMYMGRR